MPSVVAGGVNGGGSPIQVQHVPMYKNTKCETSKKTGWQGGRRSDMNQSEKLPPRGWVDGLAGFDNSSLPLPQGQQAIQVQG